MTSSASALAVIDGMLCQLARDGSRAVDYTPLATAVVEFRHGPFRVYVREHPYGLLPGIANVYCLDANFRLMWIAEWPAGHDPCAAILGEEGDALIVSTLSGAIVRLHADTGRIMAVSTPLAAAS